MDGKFVAISKKNYSNIFSRWQKESVSPLIFQQISELEVRTNLVVHYEANYQQLYNTFVDFCSSWNRTVSFLELLYHKFVESSINEEHSIL